MISGVFGPARPLIYGFEYTEIFENTQEKCGDISKKHIAFTNPIFEIEAF